MKNIKIIAITLAVAALSSCGKEVERRPDMDFSSTTASVSCIDAAIDEKDCGTEAEVDSVEITSKSYTLPETIIPEVEVTAPVTTYATIPTEELKVKSDKSSKKKEKVVYKPSTHYIHKSTCHWADDTCYEIKNTKDIECIKCTECNPDMKVIKKYKKKKNYETATGDDMIIEYENDWPVDKRLNPQNGTVEGPSGKETYYNLDMSGVISIMRGMGFDETNYPYWIRDDGCKMLGSYIMCAANLEIHPRGTLVDSTLGTCLVCDTGGFAYSNPYQLDIATNW